jgi:hypothetical protein
MFFIHTESRLKFSNITFLLYMNITGSCVSGVFWYWISEFVWFLDGIFNVLLYNTCRKPTPMYVYFLSGNSGEFVDDRFLTEFFGLLSSS